MKYLLTMTLFFSSLQLANAEDLLESYTAKIGSQDHYNSSGKRLTDAAAILRQDRANFHKFEYADPSDTEDNFFSTAANRAKMAKMIRNGKNSKSTLRIINNSEPTVYVHVYENSVRLEIK